MKPDSSCQKSKYQKEKINQKMKNEGNQKMVDKRNKLQNQKIYQKRKSMKHTNA
jgi:hypothetical protein